MANEMVVLQGNTFSIELQSRLGSTCYGWALTSLPKGIALLSATDIAPTSMGCAVHIHNYEFAAVSTTEDNAESEFTMINYAGLKLTETKHIVKIKVIASDSEEFVKYSENSETCENSDQALRSVCNSAQPYGLVMSSPEAVVKYGYPDIRFKYGYPCGVQDASQDVNVKYGYPCGVQDAQLKQGVALKYGFPCRTTTDANIMYGYPCGLQNAIMPYGYPPPYTLQESAVKYGFPCTTQENNTSCCDVTFKYGYPCGQDQPLLKYGYPEPLLKYGIPEPLLKYGYPSK